MAYGGVIVFAFSLCEIAARLHGESLIRRFGEMCIGSSVIILGGVVLLPVVLSQNLTLISVVVLFFGFVGANFLPTAMRNAAEIDLEKAGVNDENSEVDGLDISSHEERGYNFTN